MPRVRKKARRTGRKLNPTFLAFVRTLRCCAHLLSPCFGRVEADHVGWRPTGRKCDDVEAIPMCARHHDQRTDSQGPWKCMSPDQRLDWCGERVLETQAAFLLVHGSLDVGQLEAA